MGRSWNNFCSMIELVQVHYVGEIVTAEAYTKLAEILERSGYKQALELINDVLVPLARGDHVSLHTAMLMYEDDGEEQDTSWYQLWLATREMSKEDRKLYQTLDIFNPL